MPVNFRPQFLLIMTESLFVSTYDPKRSLACFSKIRDCLSAIFLGEKFIEVPYVARNELIHITQKNQINHKWFWYLFKQHNSLSSAIPLLNK